MKRAFTMIELLVTIFIFSVVMILASISLTTGFISGRTSSAGSLEVNRSLTLVLDIIGQKMVNASGKHAGIYGFSATGGPTDGSLTIYLKDNTCAYFKKEDDAIKMAQGNCGPSPTTWETISSPNIKITKFDLSNKNEWSGAKTAPYIVVEVAGQDAKTNSRETIIKETVLQSAYNIPKYTYNKW